MSDVSLTAFLDRHPRDTEADVGTVLEWFSQGDLARCTLAVDPWWIRDRATGARTGRLQVECTGVAGASIALGPDATAVEHMHESSESPRLWRFGPHATVYSSDALASPADFLVELADHLLVELRHGGGLAPFFRAEAFADWAERVSQPHLHHVLDAPAPVAAACARLLEKRGVQSTVLPHAVTARRAPLRLVAIGESWIVCEATAVRILAPTP